MTRATGLLPTLDPGFGHRSRNRVVKIPAGVWMDLQQMTPLVLADKLGQALRWLPAWSWQQLVRRERGNPVHLLIAVADHFEPSFLPASPHLLAPRDEQERRLKRWCHEYPSAMERWRDADGFPLRHTYFFPAE